VKFMKCFNGGQATKVWEPRPNKTEKNDYEDLNNHISFSSPSLLYLLFIFT
jgi:hypothetical protein